MILCTLSLSSVNVAYLNAQEKPTAIISKKVMPPTYTDAHTYAQKSSVLVKHLSLHLNVNFEQKILSGTATYNLNKEQLANLKELTLDTKDLKILSITDQAKGKLSYALGDADSILGTPLNIQLKTSTSSVIIHYQTSPTATALQWLTPNQTFGKRSPFLYTQSESIYARSWVPCPDGPGIRFTYDATVKVPVGLMALMSAENPQQKSNDGIYHFRMDLPIPAYLLALAVGDISFQKIDNRTGVYAETTLLPKAAAELTDIGRMVDTAESLYGPYRWGRYDVLVLPPGFPIGGMENPKLTFSTPTILAGDKSLVNLISHELAHNWSGNLVTNATWNDFWLNEGFTMYFERRITEKLHDKSYVDMLWDLGYQDLQATVADLGSTSQDTRLKLNLDGRNPEIGLTDIAYEKGCHFLWLIEKTVGRANFDAFINNYFNSHAFQSETTEDFIDYLNKNLLDGHDDWKKAINVNAWVYQPGIPANCPRADHERFDKVDIAVSAFKKGTPALKLKTSKWSTYEWLHFLRNLPVLTKDQMEDLDNEFHFTKTGNAEIADVWFLMALKSNYEFAYPAMKDFLMVTGRQKFLEPLYKQMMTTPDGQKMATTIYKKARLNYHPLAQANIDEIISGK